MKEKYKVTVIVPMYNVEKYIKPNLNSIINQSLNDIQIILIDDGSTDNTLKISKEICDKRENIEIYTQKNKGVSAARNFGIEKIKGEYTIFIDSDDILEENMLETLYKNILKEDADISICGFVEHLLNKNIINHYGTNNYEVFCNENIMVEFLREEKFGIGLWNKLIKSELVKKHKFDDTLKINEDKKYLFNILKDTKKIIYNDVCKYHYIAHENSAATALFSTRMFDVIKVIEYIDEDIQKNNYNENIIKHTKRNLIINYQMLYKIMIVASNRREFKNEFEKLYKKIKDFDLVVCENIIPQLKLIEIKINKRFPILYIMMVKIINKLTFLKKIKNIFEIKKMKK